METEGMDIALSLRPHFASTLLHTTPAVKQADCTGSPALQPDLAVSLPNEDLGALTGGSWSLAEANRYFFLSSVKILEGLEGLGLVRRLVVC